MSTARDRRAAYRFVSGAITSALETLPWVNEPAWADIRPEVERIRQAFIDAGAVNDEPGVEGRLAMKAKR